MRKEKALAGSRQTCMHLIPDSNKRVDAAVSCTHLVNALARGSAEREILRQEIPFLRLLKRVIHRTVQVLPRDPVDPQRARCEDELAAVVHQEHRHRMEVESFDQEPRLGVLEPNDPATPRR